MSDFEALDYEEVPKAHQISDGQLLLFRTGLSNAPTYTGEPLLPEVFEVRADSIRLELGGVPNGDSNETRY